MTTKLEKTMKREVTVDGQPHTLTVSPEGVKLVKKGCRNGVELSYVQLQEVGGESGSGQTRIPHGAGAGAASGDDEHENDDGQ